MFRKSKITFKELFRFLTKHKKDKVPLFTHEKLMVFDPYGEYDDTDTVKYFS